MFAYVFAWLVICLFAYWRAYVCVVCVLHVWAQENPGEPRRTQGSPEEPRGAQENPGEPRGAQGSPGEPRGAQGSPGEPRGAQESSNKRILIERDTETRDRDSTFGSKYEKGKSWSRVRVAFRSSQVRSSEVQKFRSQKFRSSEVHKFRSSKIRSLEVKKKIRKG